LAPAMPTTMRSTWNSADPSSDHLFWSNFILPSSQPVTMATITSTTVCSYAWYIFCFLVLNLTIMFVTVCKEWGEF
jgi:hypothetical protein